MLDRLKGDGQALDFPVYCDPKREAVKALGVYDHAHDISLPATLILDKGGKVAWKHVGTSVFDRAEEQMLIDTLKALSKKS